jgi:hypothetical protein
MIRAIFNLLRHGRAESAPYRDPFILINTFAPHLLEDEGVVTCRPTMELRWRISGQESKRQSLRMRWGVRGGKLNENKEAWTKDDSAA